MTPEALARLRQRLEKAASLESRSVEVPVTDLRELLEDLETKARAGLGGPQQILALIERVRTAEEKAAAWDSLRSHISTDEKDIVQLWQLAEGRLSALVEACGPFVAIADRVPPGLGDNIYLGHRSDGITFRVLRALKAAVAKAKGEG